MPVLVRRFPLGRWFPLAAVCAAGLSTGELRAQSPEPSEPADPSIVIARTVHPRIAYRALPAQDNPVRTEATAFPGRVFHGTLERSLAPVLGDAELDQHGSSGLSPTAATQALTGLLVPTAGNTGAGAMLGPSASAPPMGPTASVGGAVTAATAGIGDLITGSVMQALAPQNPGSGR
ncbi:hypothetical protein [Pseudomonas sp. CGJS7]|uniref:hypothetical protein n=1 Tax=Pseudomonas sp. CGJS7 TaxID=3109348 RepID=UPI00300BEF25